MHIYLYVYQYYQMLNTSITVQINVDCSKCQIVEHYYLVINLWVSISELILS